MAETHTVRNKNDDNDNNKQRLHRENQHKLREMREREESHEQERKGGRWKAAGYEFRLIYMQKKTLRRHMFINANIYLAVSQSLCLCVCVLGKGWALQEAGKWPKGRQN